MATKLWIMDIPKRGDMHTIFTNHLSSVEALQHLNGISDMVTTSLAGFKDAK